MVTTEMGKRFCKDCIHYRYNEGFDRCYAPENMTSSYHRPDHICKRKPGYINQDNKCSWYNRKRSLLEKFLTWCMS